MIDSRWRNIILILIILAIVLGGIVWYVSYNIKENMLQDDPKLRELKELIVKLDPSYAKIKLYKGNKSYTINKEKIYLCLKDEKGEYYPINMLVMVVLHEIAHLLNKDDVGHTEKFHTIFEDLKDKAAAAGIYDPLIPAVQNYCTYNDSD
jgi:hypothetical protein